MDFKNINSDKNITPNSKNNKYLVGKVLSCDSPLRFLPNYSTPSPSGLKKIVNPFEAHWRERLHLPTFSPNVFAQTSTPSKTDEEFKWSIEDISNLKPAQIDENTVSQHVNEEEDPVIDSVVQEKINRFFSEKSIVPSPMNIEMKTAPLINNVQSPTESEKIYSEGIAQTVLTLPPILPKHIENILKPFFTYTQDQQQIGEFNKDSTVYRNLFASPSCSLQSSPAMSTGLSPIQFSPISSIAIDKANGSLSNISAIPELDECNLSPINCSRNSQQSPISPVRRLSFSDEQMSVDVSSSMIVPDIVNGDKTESILYLDDENNRILLEQESLSNSTVNWDMEYKHVSLLSPNQTTQLNTMDISNTNTPHSKMFTSQRKRLSESFKNDNDDELEYKENVTDLADNCISIRRAKSKLFKDDLTTTDAGYHTGNITMTDLSTACCHSTYLFASTPSKNH